MQNITYFFYKYKFIDKEQPIRIIEIVERGTDLYSSLERYYD